MTHKRSLCMLLILLTHPNVQFMQRSEIVINPNGEYCMFRFDLLALIKCIDCSLFHFIAHRSHHQWHNMSIDSKWREFDVQSVEAIEYKICSISIAIVAIHVYLLHCHCSLHGTQTTTVQTITVVQYSAHRTLWLWCAFVPPLLLLFLLASHCLWKL